MKTLAAFVTACILAASCSSSGAQAGPTPGAQAPDIEVFSVDPASEGELMRVVERAPAVDGPISRAVFVDFTRSPSASAYVAGSTCSAEAVEGYRQESFTPQFVWEGIARPDELKAQFGLNVCDITAGAQLQEAVSMLLVAPDAHDMRESLTDAPFWGDLLEQTETGDVTIYDWGTERHRPDLPGISRFRRLGIGGELAVDNPWIFRTDGGLELPAGDMATSADRLIDRPTVRGLTELMVSHGVYGFELTEVSGTLSPEAERQGEQAKMALANWTTVGLGARATDSGERELVVVIGHSNEQDAQLNYERFPQILENVVQYRKQLELIDIDIQGRFMIASLRGRNPDYGVLAVARGGLAAPGPLFAIESSN